MRVTGEDRNIIKLLKGFIRRLKPATPQKTTPQIIPRAKHTISRKHINPNALKVLYRLNSGGYKAYLVGGCVRDLLLDYKPKDFDIATDARPEEIQRLFRNCRLIGKRFRLAHIIFGKEIIEVATFRTHHKNATHEQHAKMQQGMIIRDNVFGEIEDDAWRRDFSINALYYDIADFSVVDYVNGMHDIQHKILRIMGNPEERYHEDPVRLLRAVRIMGKLDLKISQETERPIVPLRHLLQQVSPARLFTEVVKFFQEGKTLATFHLLQKYHLFAELFPETAAHLKNPSAQLLLEKALAASDQRKREEKSISPAFLFAVFLWHPVSAHTTKNKSSGMPAYIACENAIHHVFKKQLERLTIPKNMLAIVREVCLLQHRFEQRQGKRPLRLMASQRFRHAYDLLVLRAMSGEPVHEISEWWTVFIDAPEEKRLEILKNTDRKSPRRKHSRPHHFKK